MIIICSNFLCEFYFADTADIADTMYICRHFADTADTMYICKYIYCIYIMVFEYIIKPQKILFQYSTNYDNKI